MTRIEINPAAVFAATMLAFGGAAALSQARPDVPPAKPAQTQPATNPSGAVATSPPVVVKTAPQAGSTDVDPKLAKIEVTFSKPMDTREWAFVQTNAATFPKVIGNPRFSADGRTCTLTVQLEPAKGYVIWLNSPKMNSFKDKDGQPAIPYMLVFETRK